jgi:hypothetical protein
MYDDERGESPLLASQTTRERNFFALPYQGLISGRSPIGPKVMKVPETISVPSPPAAAVAPVQAPTRSDVIYEPVLRETASAEQVSMEDTSALQASVAGGINLAATERAVRLHSLAQEVRAGTYRPNASQLADRILADAELEARLARMVH